MKKPTTLYRYWDKKIEKHKVCKQCYPQIEMGTSYGILWRCHLWDGEDNHHDFFGYATRQEAKAEEIDNIKKRIFEERTWFEKLTGAKII
jgi:hypothetical protein